MAVPHVWYVLQCQDDIFVTRQGSWEYQQILTKHSKYGIVIGYCGSWWVRAGVLVDQINFTNGHLAFLVRHQSVSPLYRPLSCQSRSRFVQQQMKETTKLKSNTNQRGSCRHILWPFFMLSLFSSLVIVPKDLSPSLIQVIKIRPARIANRWRLGKSTSWQLSWLRDSVEGEDQQKKSTFPLAQKASPI